MFAPETFRSKTLSVHPKRESVGAILAAAFNAAHAGLAVTKFLRQSNHSQPISNYEKIYLFGLGKAACSMANALTADVKIHKALIVTKRASPLTFEFATVIEGNHPIPGASSQSAGQAAVEFLSHLTANDLLICLISGGGSALMTSPLVHLEDLQTLTSALLKSGARVDEINILRRHLDQLKGGGALRYINGAKVISLILSDVVGDSLEAIASGITAPDPTTIEDAISILKKYKLLEPDLSARRHAEADDPLSTHSLSGEPNEVGKLASCMQETFKPEDSVFANVENYIIASNEIALYAAQTQAVSEGFGAEIIQLDLQGEARENGVRLANRLKEKIKTNRRPFCLLAGGETTVTVKGNGKGGRNQELALAAVNELRDIPNVMLISIATDGEDGPTDAAGAVITGETAQTSESLGLSVQGFLSRNDAYSFFDQNGGLIRTNPSGTNVNDIVLCFAF